MSPLLAFQWADLFESHWIIVLGVGLAFLGLQLALCWRFTSWLRTLQSKLAVLQKDLETGGDGRANISWLSSGFDWLRWVDAIFPSQTTTPGNYTRDDVLQELDTRIASNSNYLLLQRMGVMSPLLGVILTVLGFAWVQPPDNVELKISEMLNLVTPLVAGVGTGAILALINQGLLHVAGGKAETLRMLARNWFDAAIWKSVGLDTQAATVKSIAAIERMAQSINTAAQQQTANAEHLVASSLAMREAASQFRDMVQVFGTDIQGLPETLAELRGATAASAKALEELIPVGRRAVAGLDVSVSAFRTAVEHEFIAAAKLHHTSIAGLSDSISRISASSENLQTGSAGLRDTVEEHQHSLREMNEALRDQVLPAQSALQLATGELSRQLGALRSMLQMLADQVEAVTSEFSAVAGDLQPSVAAFRHAVDGQFTAATERHHEHVAALTASSSKLQEAAQALSAGSVAVSNLLHDHQHFARQLEPSQATLHAAVERLSEAGTLLRETVAADIGPSQRSLHEAAGAFTGSSQQLAAFIEQGLGPATQRLAELHRTLAGLDGTVKSLREFAHAGHEIERLTVALGKASDVADAIATLPDRLREALEQHAAQLADGGRPKSSITNWFRGKPVA